MHSSEASRGPTTPVFPDYLKTKAAMTRLADLTAVSVYSDGGSRSEVNTVNSSIVFKTRVGSSSSDVSASSSRYDEAGSSVYSPSLQRRESTVNPRGQEIYRRSQEAIYAPTTSSITTSIHYNAPSTIPELREDESIVPSAHTKSSSEVASVQRSSEMASLQRSNATKRKIGWLSALLSSKLRWKRFVQRFKKGFARKILRRKTKKRPVIRRVDDWSTIDIKTYNSIKRVHSQQKELNRQRSVRSSKSIRSAGSVKSTSTSRPAKTLPRLPAEEPELVLREAVKTQLPRVQQPRMEPIAEEQPAGSRLEAYLEQEGNKVRERYDLDFSKPTEALPVTPRRFSDNDKAQRVFELWKHYLSIVVANRVEMRLEIAKIAQDGDNEDFRLRRQSVLESILSDYDENSSSVFSGQSSSVSSDGVSTSSIPIKTPQLRQQNSTVSYVPI